MRDVGRKGRNKTFTEIKAERGGKVSDNPVAQSV